MACIRLIYTVVAPVHREGRLAPSHLVEKTEAEGFVQFSQEAM